MMYAYSDMESNRHNLSFQAIFCSFALLLTPKIKFGKIVKKLMEILSFYTCTPLIKIIWLWFLRYEVQQTWFFIILANFLPFYPSHWKMKISKMKKTLGYHHFMQVYQKSWCYTVPEIWHVLDVIVIFILGYTFPSYTLNSPKKSKFHKNEKNAWKCLPKIMIICYVCEIWHMTGFPTGVENMEGLFQIWLGGLSQDMGEHGGL